MEVSAVPKTKGKKVMEYVHLMSSQEDRTKKFEKKT